MASASPLSTTFYGHIASTQDALLLFEACLSGTLNHVARRPHDRERANLIKSGNVFIYEEHSSGIKRWTDGVPWSPSRILGNFLVYRELERPFPPGEKKRAMKRSKRSPGISKSEAYCPPTAVAPSNGFHNPPISVYDGQPNTNSHTANSLTKETERSLIGSLVDSYGFKEEGLVKKTVSVTVGGVSHHLVSYYTVADVMNHKFTTPSKDSRFQNIVPRPELVSKQNFRTPIDEVDSVDRMDERTVYTYVYPPRNTYEMTNQTISQRSLSLPTPPLSYPPSGVFSSFGVTPQHSHYETLAPNHSGPPFPSQYSSSSGLYSTSIKSEQYPRSGFRQQRFNSVSGVPSETARTHMPPATTNFARRPSNYEQATSIDTVVAGMSSSSESKLTPDSGYSSQGFFSGSTLRDGPNLAPHYTAHRSLPTLTHHPYERPPTNVYHSSENPAVKDHSWPMGNVNTGYHHHHHHHEHHMSAPQQQWASTGT